MAKLQSACVPRQLRTDRLLQFAPSDTSQVALQRCPSSASAGLLLLNVTATSLASSDTIAAAYAVTVALHYGQEGVRGIRVVDGVITIVPMSADGAYLLPPVPTSLVPASTPQPAAIAASSVSAGVYTGIAVGAGLGAIIIVVLAIVAYRRHAQHRKMWAVVHGAVPRGRGGAADSGVSPLDVIPQYDRSRAVGSTRINPVLNASIVAAARGMPIVPAQATSVLESRRMLPMTAYRRARVEIGAVPVARPTPPATARVKVRVASSRRGARLMGASTRKAAAPVVDRARARVAPSARALPAALRFAAAKPDVRGVPLGLMRDSSIMQMAAAVPPAAKPPESLVSSRSVRAGVTAALTTNASTRTRLIHLVQRQQAANNAGGHMLSSPARKPPRPSSRPTMPVGMSLDAALETANPLAGRR